MTWLRFFHVAFVILWFGSAAADVVLEAVLLRTPDRAGRLTLMRLHAVVDQVLEAPAVVLTLITGVLLLLYAPAWPPILTTKILVAVVPAAANLFCVKVVLDRDRWARRTAPEVDLLKDPAGRRYAWKITATGAGIPFAIAALAIGVINF
ncbi:MAG: hypothetical protein HYY13_05975 [Nitrospirae bacterium]|nr:hypothetical protein [Nitrospirota bacterium]